jgi:glutathione S-transferase
MLVVHHLDHAQSFRIVWLLEELKANGNGIDYELKLYNRTDRERMAPPEYKALSPLGTAPTITTSQGLVMNESNAIIEYILDLAGDKGTTLMRPLASSTNRSTFLFWFHAVQGSMMPVLTVDVVFRQAKAKTPCPISSVVGLVASKVRDALIMPRLRNLLEMAESQLGKTEFLAGSHLTAADISAIYPFASVFTRYSEFAKTYPNCKKWLDAMYQRNAFKVAQEKVGEKDGVVFES